MKTLKTSLIAILIVPTFALSVMAMPASASFQPAVAYDHHKQDEKKDKMKADKDKRMMMMNKKCAEADDAEKCKSDMKAKRAEHMKMMKEKCAEAEDAEKCKADQRAKMKKKMMGGEHKKDGMKKKDDQ